MAGTYQGQLRGRDERTPEMQSLLARSRLEFDPVWQRPFTGRAAGSVIQYSYFEHAWAREPRLKLPAGWTGNKPAWHVTSPKGGGRNALEYLARSIALYDARFIAHGGFQIGPQGMEDQLQPFSASYAALPAVPFETLGDKEGAIVRSAVADHARWIYAVNATEQPRTLSLRFSAAGKLRRLGLNPEEVAVSASQPLRVQLAPFELIVWKGEELALLPQLVKD